MPKGAKKNNKVSSDPMNRKETRQERKARLEAEKAAMETCQKYLPIVFVMLLVSIVGFAVFVKTLPKSDPVDPQIIDTAFQNMKFTENNADSSNLNYSTNDIIDTAPVDEDGSEETVEL